MTKIFKHVFDSKYQFPKLAETKMNGMRFYRVDGKLFPSVTTILSIQPKEGLEEWKNSVGHEAAAWEMRRAATRGTKFHKIVEAYLKNQSIDVFSRDILPMGLFNLVERQIDRIDNICTLEATMCSRSFEIAGRVDTVGDFDGKRSIIDFKSANRAKKDDQIKTHAIQETAYSVMWEEMTDETIEQIVTIVACENGESQTIIKKPHDYFDELRKCVSDFKNYQKSRMVMN
tara:strand:- start:345 stop:1034 length:690 start_codon:yes stop_codon:yes gene_type:complete